MQSNKTIHDDDYFQELHVNCAHAYYNEGNEGYRKCLTLSQDLNEKRKEFLNTFKSPKKWLEQTMAHKDFRANHVSREARFDQAEQNCMEELRKCVNENSCDKWLLQAENCMFSTYFAPEMNSCLEIKKRGNANIDPLVAHSQCLMLSPVLRIQLRALLFAREAAKELQQVMDPTGDGSAATSKDGISKLIKERIMKNEKTKEVMKQYVACDEKHGEKSVQCLEETINFSTMMSIVACGKPITKCMQSGGSFLDCVQADGESLECAKKINKQ